MKNVLRVITTIIAAVILITSIGITAFAAKTNLATPVVTLTTSKTAITVSYKAVEGATKYYIYKAAAGSKTMTLIKKTTSLKYVDKDVKENVSYSYRVKAVKENASKKVTSKSELSKTVKTSISSLAKPSVAAKSVSDSQVKVYWNAVKGAEKYYIYYSENKDTGYKCIGYTDKLSYTFTNLKYLNNYYFKIKAAKKVNGKLTYSDYSSIVTANPSSGDEFIVNFKKISNKEAGLPTGSAITCDAMQMIHYGIDVDIEELTKYFYCDDNIYKKSDGRWYGPHYYKRFVGNPKSNKAYGIGASYTLEYKACFDYTRSIGQYSKYNMNFAVYSDEPDGIKDYIRKNNIILASVDTRPDRSNDMWIKGHDITGKNDDLYYWLDLDERYMIICGYTKDSYIMYDPMDDNFKKFSIEKTRLNNFICLE